MCVSKLFCFLLCHIAQYNIYRSNFQQIYWEVRVRVYSTYEYVFWNYREKYSYEIYVYKHYSENETTSLS